MQSAQIIEINDDGAFMYVKRKLWLTKLHTHEWWRGWIFGVHTALQDQNKLSQSQKHGGLKKILKCVYMVNKPPNLFLRLDFLFVCT